MFQEQLNPDLLLLTFPIAAVTLVGFYLLIAHKRRSIRLQKIQKAHFLFQVENEKIKISRELHDTVAPFTLPLKDFVKRGGAFTESNKTEWLAEINKFEQYLSNINDNIFPVELLDGDLAEALKKLCNRLNNGDIFIELNCLEHSNISRNISIQIFRIIQESLLNAIKYSGSTVYRIAIVQKKKDMICLLSYEAKKSQNLTPEIKKFRRGLKIINQRLELLSGKYEVMINAKIKTEKFIFKNIFI